MRFMDWIIEELEAVKSWFYEAYQEVKGWIYPFYLLKYPLYGLYGAFLWLVEWFGDFNEWLDWAADRLEEIFSWENIRSLIRSWLPDLEDALDWWDRWWVWVGQEIADWWSEILPYVLTYVDNAVEGFSDLVAAWDTFWTVTWPGLLDELAGLKGEWDNFWVNIFPDLVSFTWLTTWWADRVNDVQDLIDSAFTLRDSLWAGWQDMREDVLEFFADPLEWLWARFTDWFLGPEG